MFQGKENRIIFNFSMYLDWGDIHAEKYCVKCCCVRKNVTHIHFPIFFVSVNYLLISIITGKEEQECFKKKNRYRRNFLLARKHFVSE